MDRMDRTEMWDHIDAELGLLGLPGWTWGDVSDESNNTLGWLRYLPLVEAPDGSGPVTCFVVAQGARGFYASGEDGDYREGSWEVWANDPDGDPEWLLKSASSPDWTALDAMRDAERVLGRATGTAPPGDERGNREERQAQRDAAQGVRGLPGWRVVWETTGTASRAPVWFVEIGASGQQPPREVVVREGGGMVGWKCWQGGAPNQPRRLVAHGSSPEWSLLDAMRDAERTLGIAQAEANDIGRRGTTNEEEQPMNDLSGAGLSDVQRQIVALQARAELLIRDIRAASVGRGPVPHALNIAATHAQDAYAALLVAGHGGSPGIPG